MIRGRPPTTALKRYRSYLKNNYPKILDEIDERERKYRVYKLQRIRDKERVKEIKIPKDKLAEFHKDAMERINRLNDEGWLNITRDKIKRFEREVYD